jgi:hypothetical protein
LARPSHSDASEASLPEKITAMKGYSRFVFFLMVLKCALFTSLNGQNLIPNPGFEELLYCDTTLEWSLNVTSWQTQEQSPLYWAGGQTPDFFHSCNFKPNFPYKPYSQPYTWPSFQYPNSGEGFCGMFWVVNVVLDPMYHPLLDTLKEYTHVPLLDTPDSSLDYCVGMHVGNIFPSAYFEDSVFNYLTVFLNRFTIGLRSQPPIYEIGGLMPSDTVLFLTADDGAVVRDTQNFTLVRTPFRPSGTERYFIIGNMLHDVDTEYEMVSSLTLDSIITYFFEQYAIWGNQVAPGAGLGYFYFDDVFFQAIHPPQIGVHLSDIPGKVWLVDTTTHEEKRWYKTGDDFVISTSDSVLVDAQQGVSYTVQTRNCRLNYTDTLVLDFTSLNNLYKPRVRVYPNPASHSFVVNVSEDQSKHLDFALFNMNGQCLIQYPIKSTQSSIEISQLPAGLYLLRFVDEQGNVATEKIVVER